MLKWNRNCYIGAGIRDINKIQEKLNEGRFVPGVYLITLPSNPNHLLDLLPAAVLVQDTVKALCPEIIGAAGCKDDAISLAASILENVYRETGTFQVQEYIKNR